MLDIERIFELRETLRSKNGWEYSIQTLKDQTLNLIGEVGEVTDIYKKKGVEKISTDEAIREHFTEEMVDVLFYYFNMLMCAGITPEELEAEFLKKHNEVMNRDFAAKWAKE